MHEKYLKGVTLLKRTDELCTNAVKEQLRIKIMDFLIFYRLWEFGPTILSLYSDNDPRMMFQCGALAG